jgi:pimeloyl-ACP methyl ester carboxylesterase
VSTPEHVQYDEFGLFNENADEYGLVFDGPPSVRRESVEVEPGRCLSALAWGIGEPELVLLHGGAQNAHTWDTVAMALRPRPLVAIDLPGHGHSDSSAASSGVSRSPRAVAGEVAAAIVALAPNARGVVGMSYGGLVAIALADLAPELVRRVLLVDVLPGLRHEHARHIVDFVNGPATFPRFDDLLERTIKFNPNRSVSSLRRGILHNALQLDDGSWVWRHSRWRLNTVADGNESSKSAPAHDRVHEDLMESLGRISVPVLLARGMRSDSVLRDEDETALLQHLPDATVVHFEEAGHSIQGDMPLELAATIQDFIP